MELVAERVEVEDLKDLTRSVEEKKVKALKVTDLSLGMIILALFINHRFHLIRLFKSFVVY